MILFAVGIMGLWIKEKWMNKVFTQIFGFADFFILYDW